MGDIFPGSGGAQASIFRVKGHPTRIKLQKIPRDDAEHGEGKEEAQGKGGQRTRRHHPGPAGDWAACQGRNMVGAGVRLMQEGIGRRP